MSLTFSDILEIEDTPELTNFKCPVTGIVVWPLVRNYVFRVIISDLFYGAWINEATFAKRSLTGAVRTLARTMMHNAGSYRSGGDVGVMASGLRLRHVDGKWFNAMSDHFADALPEKTCVVEDTYDWTWPFPRHFDKVTMTFPIKVGALVVGAARSGSSTYQTSTALIDLVLRRAKSLRGIEIADERRAFLIKVLARKTVAIPFEYSRYKSMFKRLGIKVLLKHLGFYGSSAVPIAAAKSLGIHTAEFQHGLISSGHDAYNFAPTIADSPDMRRIFPDYFLSYGQWWSDQINAPVKHFVIGNAEREIFLAENKPSLEPKRDVLVLGDGIDTADYLAFASFLVPTAEKLGLRVVFRPHPSERQKVEAMGLDVFKGFTLDREKGVYPSLSKSHAVVSENSNTLFEAIGLADRIFVWDTPKSKFNMENHPFVGVPDATSFAENLSDDAIGRITTEHERSIWAPNWKENYFSFLRSLDVV